MANKLGMNTEQGRQIAANLSGAIGTFYSIENQLRIARTMSLSPLDFLLNPGAMILTPVSIGMAAQVQADLANARSMVEYLATKLQQEAQQQQQVSDSLHQSDPGWFAPGPTAKRPETDNFLNQLWDDFRYTISTPLGILSDLVTIADNWWKSQPDWVKTVSKYAGKFGKALPWVGTGISITSIFTDWDPDNVWGNTRNIVGASLDVLSIVTLIPPLTPAAPVIAVVGVVWDVMDLVWDAGDDFGWW